MRRNVKQKKNPIAAAKPTSRRARLKMTKLPDSAHSASESTQASALQRPAAGKPRLDVPGLFLIAPGTSVVLLGLANAGTAAGCGHAARVTAEALPVHRVVVYRNGVAYFERAGHVAESEVRFKMKRAEVGDFLATLAVIAWADRRRTLPDNAIFYLQGALFCAPPICSPIDRPFACAAAKIGQ